MIDYLTTNMNRPTEYEFKKVAMTRGLIKSKKERSLFKLLERGVIGERRFHDILQEFGAGHWVCLRNTWLNEFSDFECDFILVTSHCVYVFEIKNYFGKFVYQNGRCSSRGTEITYNPINQANHATVHLRKITDKFANHIRVKGVLVFIGEHNAVHIEDAIDYLDIVRSNEVYQYIEEIKIEERISKQMIDADRLIAHYEPYMISNPHASVPYSSALLKDVRTGAYCYSCGRLLSMTRSNYVHCTCSFDEFKEQTIVRAACEYGVLTFGTPFKPVHIKKFLGDKISNDYLRVTLCKHFEKTANAGVLAFNNPGRPIAQLAHQFHFEHPNIIYKSSLN